MHRDCIVKFLLEYALPANTQRFIACSPPVERNNIKRRIPDGLMSNVQGINGYERGRLSPS